VPVEETAVPPEPSPTIIPPSPTPQLAALVNGQPILLETFDEELMRYETAQAELGFKPGADGQDYQRLVLDALIERELIGQAAKVAGISVEPDAVEAKLTELRESEGEADSFETWLAVNHWTEETFKEALAAEMLVEAMIAEVTSDVPLTVEQVRASYIQVDDGVLADSLLQQINEGADFSDLAERYSRDSVTGPAGGDLGFFARGSLLVSEVEDAAYQLQPGEVSEVISVADSETGNVTHYIVMVTERDPDRPLNTNLRHELLQESFDSWMADQWTNATIVYLLEEG
jgi:parvulin-like peptidyl-prolyl isomerase